MKSHLIRERSSRSRGPGNGNGDGNLQYPMTEGALSWRGLLGIKTNIRPLCTDLWSTLGQKRILKIHQFHHRLYKTLKSERPCASSHRIYVTAKPPRAYSCISTSVQRGAACSPVRKASEICSTRSTQKGFQKGDSFQLRSRENRQNRRILHIGCKGEWPRAQDFEESASHGI